MPLRCEDEALIVHKNQRSKHGIGHRNTKKDSLALFRAGLRIIGAAIKFPLWAKNRKKKKSDVLRYSSILLLIPLLYLKELHSDASKHELQQRGDDHDVADGPDGHKDALDHMLQKHKNKKTYTLLHAVSTFKYHT